VCYASTLIFNDVKVDKCSLNTEKILLAVYRERKENLFLVDDECAIKILVLFINIFNIFNFQTNVGKIEFVVYLNINIRVVNSIK
jgi:hypothetical protein